MPEAVLKTPARFRGPNSGIVATVFVVLFFAGLMPVTAFGGMPYFPGPTASVNEMVAFFSQRQAGTLLCAFLQFGSAVPLGVFPTSMVARLKFRGVRAAGADMALFGGLATAMGLVIPSCALWAMTYPGIPQDANLLQALYRVCFGLAGPGYSVFFRTSRSGNSCDRLPLQALAEVYRHSRVGCSCSWRTQLVRDLKRQVASADSSYPRFCLDDCRWILAFQITQRGGHP